SSLFASHEDYDGNLWLSTNAGTIIQITKNDSVKKYDLRSHDQNFSMLSFYETSDNEMWVISRTTFYKFDKENFIPLSGPLLKEAESLPYYYISKGNAVFLTDKGIERLINKNYGVIIPALKIPYAEKVLRLHYTERNDIWITNQKDQT